MVSDEAKALRRLPLVLGMCLALGASGTVLGVAAVRAWDEPLPPTPAFELPEAPEGDAETWRLVQEAFEALPERHLAALREKRPALNALAVINLASSVLLFAGALFCRMRTRRPLALLRTSLVLGQGYAAIAFVVQLFVQLALLEVQRPILRPLFEGSEAARDLAMLGAVAQGSVVLVSLGLIAAQFLFYVFAQRFFRRPVVEAFLTGGPTAPA